MNFVSAVEYRIERLGKLIVVDCEDQVDQLQRYQSQAYANGVEDLRLMSRDEARALEPELSCYAALYSPSTGHFDSHSYLLALLADLEKSAGQLVVNCKVNAVQMEQSYFAVLTGRDEEQVKCKYLINAAGLGAQQLARTIRDFPLLDVPRQYFARGHYFKLNGIAPFSRLIYPLAEVGGLGIHFTLDQSGQALFGPDVEWIDDIDYSFDADPNKFATAIQSYYPNLDPQRLQPAYTGIRPKLVGPKEAAADFMIQGPERHGVAGLINLFGIESPGLTASLAVGDYVAKLLNANS